MNNVFANRLSAPQRTTAPAFSAARPPVQKATPIFRCSERQQSARDVRMRAGQDDVGSSYANALVDLAQEQNVLEDIHSNVETINALFKEDPDVKDLLTNPIITEDKKKDIISKIADKAEFSEYFVNFLNILIDQDRLVSGEAIFDAFEKRYSELTDTQIATIYSAVKLEQEQQFLVAKKIQEMSGAKNKKLKTVIDESLIAGFVVDFGSAQIDLSVKGQLEDVAQDLVAAGTSLDVGPSKSSSSNGSGGVPQDDLLKGANVEKEVEQELSKAKEAALA